jgi:hypothetical protein
LFVCLFFLISDRDNDLKNLLQCLEQNLNI